MKVESLKKWKNELNICIRCGYCYEHCHLFKMFGWESDSPRGKLILVYGLLTGDIQPSVHVAEKIFECFYCKDCEKSCSAKVPVTDIFTTAKEFLISAGFDVDGTTAKIDENVCSGCGICLPVCKSEASSLIEKDGKRQATIDKIKCHGCGICISACPASAVIQRDGFGISPRELATKVFDYLGKAEREESAKIVIFCCNWSMYPWLQSSTLANEEGKSSPLVVTICASRISPELVLETFDRGAWGVLIAACPIDECEHGGDRIILRRILLLKKMLEQLNIDPKRIKLERIVTGESAKLQDAINRFRDEIAGFGPIRS